LIQATASRANIHLRLL